MQEPRSTSFSISVGDASSAHLAEDHQAALDLAMEASRLVWWDWDVGGDRMEIHTGAGGVLTQACAGFSGRFAAWLARVHPDDLALVRSAMERCLVGGAPRWDCEYRMCGADGAWFWVASHGRATERDPATRRVRRMIGTTRDIHARKRAEAELERDAALLAYIQDAVYCVDAEQRYTYWNLGAERLFGWSAAELLGKPFGTRLPPEVVPDYLAILRRVGAGETFSGEMECHRRDGSRIWVDMQAYRLMDARGRPAGIMAVVRDISARRREQMERQRIEHQLAQSQKMETLGTLAGGIAHDFNNLLAAILGYVEIAGGLLPEGHPALAKLDNVSQAGKRAAELVRRILAFSRASEQTRAPADLNMLVREALSLLRASLPSTIAIEPTFSPSPAVVLGDATQLQQIIINCCANSSHALRERSDGRIKLAVELIDLETAPPVEAGALRAGAYVRLSVADNGCGMSEEVRAHVFEPFFTTKPSGEGTGLGLALAHGIVTAHGGAIRVRSVIGAGTTFEIYLPALLQRTHDVEAEPGPAIPATRGQGETIAVIDDEESIALLAQQALEHHGYRAVTFNRARDCLEQLLARPDAFRLVIIDQTMPQMTGLELIKSLRAVGNTVPVLMFSGYARGVAPAELAGIPRVAFLGKPFDLAVLLREVHRLLHEPV